MQMTFEVQDILRAVATVQAVVDKKNSIPVLSNILIDADAATQRARVVATNLELGSLTYCPVTTIESGSITIPAQKIFEILRELPDAPVKLTVDEKSWVTLECKKSNFKIAGLPKTDFPELPTLADALHELTLPGEALAGLLSATLFAVSHDESRYTLCGVNFDFKNDTLNVVATDGHRLACHTLPVEPGEDMFLILPLRGAVELKKMCGNEAVTLRWTKNAAQAVVGDSLLSMRLIDGTFPDYRQVIPSAAMMHEATVSIAEMQRTLRRVALLCSDTRLVKLFFSKDTLTIAANDPNTGEAADSCACDYAGENFSIGCNARYLMDALAVLPGETVTIGMNDALAPLLLTCPANAGIQQVIMPMRM